MHIFLSYASQDREVARSVERALTEQGHDVFFDRDDLPPGEEYHARIRRAIEESDLLVLLVTPDAVDAGSYTLSEVDVAERAWRRAGGRLLPVMVRPTPIESLPHFVRSVTVLDATGHVPATVAAAVHRLQRARRRRRLVTAGGLAAALALILVLDWGVTHREPATRSTGRDGATALLVPGGPFVMGDDEDSPRRTVHVEPFYIDETEVTVGQFADFVAATGWEALPDGWEQLNVGAARQLPVIGVDWFGAQAYCDWTGRRLPTEAEWEKAARGEDERRFPWGDRSPTLDEANFQNMSPTAYDGGLAPVGTHRAGDSPYGVADMAGNAAEWVADWFSESFASGDVYNPRGPEAGEAKVIRGGGRFDPGERIAATRRYRASPDTRGEDIGFRCARDAG